MFVFCLYLTCFGYWLQELENEKLKTSHAQLIEENSGLRSQNQKLAEEASYAKELASAAAVELKNLAGEVTKLSLQNARQAKELLAAQDMVYSRGSNMHPGAGGTRKLSESKVDGVKLGRKGRLTSKGNENTVHDDVEFWNLDRSIWRETENPSPIGELKISLPIPKDGLFALTFDCSSSNILFTVVF